MNSPIYEYMYYILWFSYIYVITKLPNIILFSKFQNKIPFQIVI